VKVGKFLVVAGAVIMALGFVVWAGFPVGRLPGDFTVRRGPATFYFPLATSILISVILSLILMFFRR
jgi:Protein of unknown function (DUF2905)